MAFRELRLVAYEVPTFFRTNMPRGGDVPSPLTQAIAGEVKEAPPDSLSEDLLARVAHLERVLEAARAGLGELPRDTLPVFMVPEFFFRHPERPYLNGEFALWLDALKTWSEKVPEWLLVPGSCWWGAYLSPRASPGLSPVLLVNNTSVLLQGGRVVHSLVNQLPFGADGFQSTGTGCHLPRDGSGALLVGRELYAIWHLLEEVELTWDLRTLSLPFLGARPGILHLGLEVGLDHVNGMLYDELERDAPGVDVHLLTSCGIPRLDFHVAARNGGCLLRCDGAFQEETPRVMAPASEALRVVRRGDRVRDWMEGAEVARVLMRLTTPVDGVGERLAHACRERRIAAPALVLHEGLELLTP
jgi:hypothetical protein